VDGQAVRIGTARLLEAAGVGTGERAARARALAVEGKTAMLVAAGGRPAGLIGVSDPVKDDSSAAVAALKQLGLDVVMITGDARRTAEAVARAAGIGKGLSEFRPEDKASEVARLQADRRHWGMSSVLIIYAPTLAH